MNATHIELKTFHKDGNDNTKEKTTDIPIEHIMNGSIRTYEDKGKEVIDKSIITCGHYKHFIAMSKFDLKSLLSEKINYKSI